MREAPPRRRAHWVSSIPGDPRGTPARSPRRAPRPPRGGRREKRERPRAASSSVVAPRARIRPVTGDLVRQSIDLPRGPLRLLQPREAAELPDSGGVEWAPIAPYWAVLWRSGVALARELDGERLGGVRVVELGCGLGAPSLAAARAGASVLATDGSDDALTLLARSARANGVRVETARTDWASPGELLERAPFDLVLAADVLYERAAVAQLL